MPSEPKLSCPGCAALIAGPPKWVCSECGSRLCLAHEQSQESPAAFLVGLVAIAATFGFGAVFAAALLLVGSSDELIPFLVGSAALSMAIGVTWCLAWYRKGRRQPHLWWLLAALTWALPVAATLVFWGYIRSHA